MFNDNAIERIAVGTVNAIGAIVITDSMNTLEKAIEGAMRATPAGTRARKKALASVKWRLRSPSGLYAGPGDGLLESALVAESDAYVFDGRDNEQLKARYFSAVLKTPMMVELVSFAI